MQSSAKTVSEYIKSIPKERMEAFVKLRQAILDNIPAGFEECMSYGMIGYVVPFSLYPDGYHTGQDLPLPFVCLASQKNFIALYHMGIGSDSKLLDRFTSEYAKQCKTKLDMGKGCIRLKKLDDIPYNLIGELLSKMAPAQRIEMYEKLYKKKRK